jgi:hypothetical protein
VRALLVIVCLGACWRNHPAANDRRERVYLTPVRVAYNASHVWFPDELIPVADAVADALAARGYRVVPTSELRALWDSVQHGHVPGVAHCTAVPPPAEVAAFVNRDALQAEPTIECEGSSCKLDVSLSRDMRYRGHPEEVARFGLAIPATPAAIAERVRRQGLTPEPRPESESGGLAVGTLGPPGPGPHLHVDVSATEGPWSPPLDRELLQPYAEALTRCREQGGVERDWWSQYHVLEIAPDGHLSRCTFEHVDRLPPAGFECSCDVLRGIDFGRAPAARRATVFLHAYRTEPNDGWYRSVYVGDSRAVDDETALLGEVHLPRGASTCLAPIAAATKLEVPVRLAIGPDGVTTAATASWPATLPTQVTRCLDGVLRRSDASCPRSGKATIEVTLHVDVAR